MTHSSSNSRLRKISQILCSGILTWAAASSLYGTESVPATPGTASSSSWSASASIAVKETFDENVYLQNVTSNAFRHSFVTTVLPSVSISYKPADVFHATLSYSPDVTFFHSEPGEDFSAHRVQLSLGGSSPKTEWELNENFLAIDGNELGPSFYGPGGAPAAGGPQIRDRRAAMVDRGQVRLTQHFGSWFLRPVLSGYYQGFQTIHRITPGYQNYVDRSDWNAGGDFGKEISQSTRLSLGYRYGQQTQARLLDFPEHYDNDYDRVLFGFDAEPAPWLELSICAGPEFRHYGTFVSRGFDDRDELIPFVDSTLRFLISARDMGTISAKVFQQPGFSGRSAYMDSTYETTWRHKFSQKFTIGAGLRAYNTDFLKPTARNDWIITPSLIASYTLNRHLGIEAYWLYDDDFSLIANTQGRDYSRNAISIGAKFSL